MKPPWQMRWPFTMCGCTIIAITASPGLISTSSMPRPLLSSSCFHIACAQARAKSSRVMSSGNSVALTFTSNSLSAGPLQGASCLIISVGRDTESVNAQKELDVVVVDHDLPGARLGLAGENKARLQLPRLQRIVQIHRRIALDQLGAAGRAHAALAGEWQVHAGAQRGVEDRLAVGHRHLAALAVDNQSGHRLRRCTRSNNGLRPRLAAEFRDKALDMDTLVGDADLAAGRLDRLAHPARTADEDMVDGRGRHQRAQQHPHLLAIEPPVQDRDVLLLA